MLTGTYYNHRPLRGFFTMSYIHIVLNIIPTIYEGYIVSVHRMVMENRPVDPGSRGVTDLYPS